MPDSHVVVDRLRLSLASCKLQGCRMSEIGTTSMAWVRARAPVICHGRGFNAPMHCRSMQIHVCPRDTQPWQSSQQSMACVAAAKNTRLTVARTGPPAKGASSVALSGSSREGRIRLLRTCGLCDAHVHAPVSLRAFLRAHCAVACCCATQRCGPERCSLRSHTCR